MCIARQGETLLEHLEGVKQIGLEVYNEKKNLHFSIPESLILPALSNMLFYHDIGKSTQFFQEYIKASINGAKYSGEAGLINHSLISAIYAAYKTHLEVKSDLLSIIVFLAVRKHHGDFQDVKDMLSISKVHWNKLKIQWKSMDFDCIKEKNEYDFEEVKDYISDLLFDVDDIKDNIENYFLLNFFFSILTYSDKNDAKFRKRHNQSGLPLNSFQWVDFYKKKHFKTNNSVINNIREDVYNSCINNIPSKLDNAYIFSINAPTGSGKTLAGLNTALNILKNDRNMKRIIYCLPFTSIVEQTYGTIKDVISANGEDPNKYIVKHHHLAEAKIEDNENSIEGEAAQFLIENWDKPIIITTFWQFFNTLISNKNKQIRKFHNFANSVVILDEIQTMPMEYWTLTKEILTEMAYLLNSKFIIMTATMPLIFPVKEIISLIGFEKAKSYFNMIGRYQMMPLKKPPVLDIDNLVDIANKKLSEDKNKSYMFVFNTIQSSVDFYKKLKRSYDGNIIYLSGNIVPKDREDRIKIIKNASGRKVVISTQLIEAGVDIDLDVVFRDFAPFDSLIQTAGRCNRNNRNIKGEVYTFTLVNKKNNHKYCNYIYKPLSLQTTQDLIQNIGEIEESKLADILDEYYKTVQKHKSNDLSRVIKDALCRLLYEKTSNKFQLIDDIPTTLVFVEKDDEASILLNKFKRLITLEPIRRKDEFLKIKKQFYEYILSVKINKKTTSLLESLEEIGNFKIITADMYKSGSFYKDDIGLFLDFENFI